MNTQCDSARCRLSQIVKEHRQGIPDAHRQKPVLSTHRMLKTELWTRVAGGASRDRTDDPLLAKQVLSQLSYGPEFPA